MFLKVLNVQLIGEIYKTRFFKLESNDDKYEDALLQQEEEIEDKDEQIFEN